MFAATRGGNNPFNPAVSYYVGSEDGTTSVSLSGLSLQQNDLVVAVTGGHTASGASWTPGPTTSGYTQAVSIVRLGGGGDIWLYVGYKVMGSTPDTSIAFTANPSGAASTNSVAYVWRSINTSSPMAATPTTATSDESGSTNLNSPSISFSGNAIVLSIGMLRDETVTAAPSGMINFAGQNVGTTYLSSSGLASISATSSYDPGAFTTTDTGRWCAATLALAL